MVTTAGTESIVTTLESFGASPWKKNGFARTSSRLLTSIRLELSGVWQACLWGAKWETSQCCHLTIYLIRVTLNTESDTLWLTEGNYLPHQSLKYGILSLKAGHLALRVGCTQVYLAFLGDLRLVMTLVFKWFLFLLIAVLFDAI